MLQNCSSAIWYNVENGSCQHFLLFPIISRIGIPWCCNKLRLYGKDCQHRKAKNKNSETTCTISKKTHLKFLKTWTSSQCPEHLIQIKEND